MSKKIQLATHADLKDVWTLRLKATEFLNSQQIDQWQFEDPTINDFKDDIDKNELYVYKEGHEIIGMFALKFEVEPTYNEIFGQWHYDLPYATVHRLALNVKHQKKGIAYDMLVFAESIAKQRSIKYMRIDTHDENINAQKLFSKMRYIYCGTIMLTIKHGEKLRLAYDKLLE